MLAGVAATGEEEFFSMISAGIFFIGNIPQNHSKLRSTDVGKKDDECFQLAIFNSPFSPTKIS